MSLDQCEALATLAAQLARISVGVAAAEQVGSQTGGTAARKNDFEVNVEHFLNAIALDH